MLAKVLTGQIGRFVKDQTEIQGVFDLALDWAPDTNVGGPDSQPASSVELQNGPSIFTAIKEQLGFRLDARKGPGDVIVIDRVENPPSEN
jgi:uncharacterized protein (TIGR03435 family)